MPSTTRELEYAVTTARSILAELDDPDPDSDMAYGQYGTDWPDVLADTVRVLLDNPQPPCATTDQDASRAVPRLEIVTYRDPDGDTSLRLFADGTEVDPDRYVWVRYRPWPWP